MTSLLLQILPVAIIITINPVPAVAALVVSTTQQPRACGLAYVATLVVGMALFGALVLLVFGGSLVESSGASTPFVRWAWLLIGVAFLVAFVVLLARRPRPAGAPQPRWMGLVAGMGPLGAVVVGVLLVNYEMQTPAMLDILAADVDQAAAAALALFVVFACTLPTAVVAAVLGATGLKPAIDVDHAKAWLARYNRPVLLVLFAAVGAVYSTEGPARTDPLAGPSGSARTAPQPAGARKSTHEPHSGTIMGYRPPAKVRSTILPVHDRPGGQMPRLVPYTATAMAVGPVFRSAFRLKVIARERIPAEGPLVIVANHESNLDGFVLISVFRGRRLTFLSAAHLFQKRGIGRYLRAIGSLPVEEEHANVASFRRAIEILGEGGTVAIFPQGGSTATRSRAAPPTSRSRPTRRSCRCTSRAPARPCRPTTSGPRSRASRRASAYRYPPASWPTVARPRAPRWPTAPG